LVRRKFGNQNAGADSWAWWHSIFVNGFSVGELSAFVSFYDDYDEMLVLILIQGYEEPTMMS